jgi:hypothetical protein
MLLDMVSGNIDFGADSFKLMLVTSSYAPSKDGHTRRSDISNEVLGAGYVAGGAAITPTVSQDLGLDQTKIAWSDVAWASSSITARGGVVYKSRGGLPEDDELVGYLDFGGDVSSTNGTFTVTVLTPIVVQG